MPPRRRESSPTPPALPRDLLNWPPPWLCALIFSVVLLAFWPAIGAGFIWDDAGHVTRAELLPWSGLWRIWFEPGATQQYYPVLHSAFWIEHHIFGDAPLGYHLLNILLHATAACLLGLTLRRLAIPGAWLAALLFALHPVCVESVAWVAEQKNTLSTVFYLCAALAYLRFDADRRPGRYALATGLFLLALGTKTVTATLPAALLVIFWWQRGRLSWRRDVVPLLPWFACGIVAGWYTASFERTHIGADGADFSLTLLQRALIAGRVTWFYFGKLLWPSDLIFIYPRWTVDATELWQYLFPLAAIAALVGLGWWASRRRGPLAAALFFGGTLFPALGFFNVYPFIFSFVADHFQYLASMGILAAAAAGLTQLAARLPNWISYTAGALVCSLLGTLTWQQSETYHDVFTLYETTLARNPDCWMAHNNLGNALVETGRADEAIAQFEQTLKLRPNFSPAESNLGDQLTRVGRVAEAIPHLQRAVQLQPNFAEAHNNLGVAFIAAGREAEAIGEFWQSLRFRPDYAQAHFNLGLALSTGGNVAEGIPHFQEAVRLQPDFADAQVNWGVALIASGRPIEALSHFAEAVRLKPDRPDTHFSFGRALANAGRLDEAVAQFKAAIDLSPDYAEAHLNLAVALRQLGRMDEATGHYTEALRLNPALGSGQH